MRKINFFSYEKESLRVKSLMSQIFHGGRKCFHKAAFYQYVQVLHIQPANTVTGQSTEQKKNKKHLSISHQVTVYFTR